MNSIKKNLYLISFIMFFTCISLFAEDNSTKSYDVVQLENKLKESIQFEDKLEISEKLNRVNEGLILLKDIFSDDNEAFIKKAIESINKDGIDSTLNNLEHQNFTKNEIEAKKEYIKAVLYHGNAKLSRKEVF